MSSNAGVSKVDAMLRYILTRGEEDATEDSDAVRSFARSIVEMVDSAEESEVGVRGMLKASVGLRKIARDLSPVSKVLERALNRYLSGFHTISGWREPFTDLIERLEEPGGETAGRQT